MFTKIKHNIWLWYTMKLGASSRSVFWPLAHICSWLHVTLTWLLLIWSSFFCITSVIKFAIYSHDSIFRVISCVMFSGMIVTPNNVFALAFLLALASHLKAVWWASSVAWPQYQHIGVSNQVTHLLIQAIIDAYWKYQNCIPNFYHIPKYKITTWSEIYIF